jgi:hypothetical protein
VPRGRKFQRGGDESRKAAILGGTILGALIGGGLGAFAADQRMDRDCEDGCFAVPPYVAVYVGGGLLGGAVVGGVLGAILSRASALAQRISR